MTPSTPTSPTSSPEAASSTAPAATGTPPGTPPPRQVDLRLAALHLRTGSYALARAELETMAGNGTLDDDALLDLAEVRWRTGDLPGAGEAAAAFLTSGRESVLALVIAAEATAALGRPGEARRLAGRAMEAADGPLEPLFAGLSRSPIWPQDPADPAEPAGRFFADEGGRRAGRAAAAPAGAGLGTSAGATNSPEGGEPGGPRGEAAAKAPGQGPDEAVPASLWDAHLHGAHAHAALPPPDMPNGATVLDAARRAMEAGDLEAAAVQLALVLRVSPGLAPAVLDVAGSTAGAELDLIRGDAYRLVGHEAEAQRAYASAIATVAGAAAPASQAAASVPPAVPVAPAESPGEPEPPAADPPPAP
jgi:hypothetical protein